MVKKKKKNSLNGIIFHEVFTNTELTNIDPLLLGEIDSFKPVVEFGSIPTQNLVSI